MRDDGEARSEGGEAEAGNIDAINEDSTARQRLDSEAKESEIDFRDWRVERHRRKMSTPSLRI